jgi:hypothetical protein
MPSDKRRVVPTTLSVFGTLCVLVWNPVIVKRRTRLGGNTNRWDIAILKVDRENLSHTHLARLWHHLLLSCRLL